MKIAFIKMIIVFSSLCLFFCCKSTQRDYIQGNWYYWDMQDSSYNEVYISGDKIVFNNEFITLSKKYSYRIKRDTVCFFYNHELTNKGLLYSNANEELIFVDEDRFIRMKRLQSDFDFFEIEKNNESLEEFLFEFKLRYQKEKK